MKHPTSLLIIATALSAVGCASSVASHPAASTARATDSTRAAVEITQLLEQYESALNAADVPRIATLYTQDAVFMAQHREPAVGLGEVRASYEQILSQIRLDIVFEIDEVVVVSADVAYARTQSRGSVKIVEGGAEIEGEANQELFVLRRQGADGWKIARYIFSTTNPPAPKS